MPRPRGPKAPKKLPAAAEASATAGGAPAAAGTEPASTNPTVARYADSLEELSTSAAELERSLTDSYCYCLRTVATYEYAYFGPSGQLRRALARAVQHGTGFAYREKGAEHYLVTNQHVAQLPEVTTSEGQVEGIPRGARKVRQTTYIVGNEDDRHVSGFIELTLVMADPLTDLAILKTTRELNLMPHPLGSSADLRVGNLVVARGYPLGVMPTLNIGRVSNAHHVDTDAGWDHVDFITDAALNSGNSGSPVFAISRTSGELELVGVFHAHYKTAAGMGVVVGIDEIRELLETMRPPERQAKEPDDRVEGRQLLGEVDRPVYFPFAGLTARAVLVGNEARFEVYEDFPASETVQLALLSSDGSPQLEVPAGGSLDANAAAELRQPLEELETELWGSLATAMRLRRANAADDGSPASRRRIALLQRRLSSSAPIQQELLSVVGNETEIASAQPARRAKRGD